MSETNRWPVIVLLLVILAGCTSGPRRGAPAPVSGGASAATLPERVEETPSVSVASPRFSPPSDVAGSAASPGTSPAVVALLTGAEQKRTQGDLDAAAAALERALRIEPRNAQLWHRLARIRFEQRRYRAAIDLATRSSSLAHGDSRLKAANRALIERAGGATR